MDPYARLAELKITLPAANQPTASFAMAAQTGNLVFISGHISRKDGKPWAGQLGLDMEIAEAQAAARSIGLDLLATLQAFLGDLKRVERIVKLLCLVNSTPQFTQQHVVANGCSDLIVSVFGEAGRHARSAIGVAQLPMGACVEVEAVVQVR